ncbi:MAG: 50S ribosomal protein L11 [Phycisphaerales bacterium]|nr:50S ribosomal protein L11 [Phycisphaerales bacterium]
MAKVVTAKIKVQAPGGKATPAPPIGPALGQHGVNIAKFVQEFNAATKHMDGMICPCEITVYKDKSFEFVVKSPPASALLVKAAKPLDAGLALVEKGSGEPNRKKVGRVTQADLRKIAETKLKDMNAFDLDAAAKVIAGTARSMGIVVVD